MPEDILENDVHNEHKKYQPHVRWAIPYSVDHMTFVGGDVLAVAHDIYIIFFNFKTNSELVYTANCENKGDGVDVITGHRTNIFAFAEKVKEPRILVTYYPRFNILVQLRDSDINRYKALAMMENDLISGFGGFPDYLITVWNWRTQQRLIAMPTNVLRMTVNIMASQTHMLICQCWEGGLNVWEVAQSYKRCLLLKRSKEEASGGEVTDLPLVAVCWASDGQLYATDVKANLFCLISDGVGMVKNLEWSENLTGNRTPCMCSFHNGILLYGPDKCIRSLKKLESNWTVAWSIVPEDDVVRLVSNSTSDVAAMWTEKGLVYELTGETEEKIDLKLFTFKQRNITRIQLIAPEYTHVATVNNAGVLCLYETFSGKLVSVKYVKGHDISFEASPVDPLLIIYGEVGNNYGMALYTFDVENVETSSLRKVGSMCLTHQIVSRVVFSPTGRELVAAAMSAGHIFIFKLSVDYKLTLVRYTEIGRGLADCFMMRVGEAMRVFCLVLYSDKYAIGERIVCISVETGKDNKLAGKMAGPYGQLVPLKTRDSALAVPHLSSTMHVLRFSGDKGTTVSVKMAPILETGHDLKQYYGFYNVGALLTYGFDGVAILRQPDAAHVHYDLKLVVTHRYESGVKQAVIDDRNTCIAHLANNKTFAVHHLNKRASDTEVHHEPPELEMFDENTNTITITDEVEKNYLDIQEERKVKEEMMENKKQREEVMKNLETVKAQLVALLEENLAERPLHQLPLGEFNLHVEHKKERMKQAEKEREQIRQETNARIRSQDKVAAWIKANCWDVMLTQRVKLFAIFSHYQVENYPVLPTQRSNWPELQQIEALRSIEMENDADLFQPWVESREDVIAVEPHVSGIISAISSIMKESRKSFESQAISLMIESETMDEADPQVLAGSSAHRFIEIPAFMIPQTLSYSFLQMNWLHHIVKLNVQKMRLWFNKQFDELMRLKKREVGLVRERNNRLRFIVDELNKLSDLRGSFHHLNVQIVDPEWHQEEEPEKLIRVDPEECSIEPYISPSQVVIPPPEPKPKDDFRERALNEMMDGVLEKLWHEEIKKPIPIPQCMLKKDPEHFNEDDLRIVFDYEAKVAFRNEERDKYRKMMHAEYAKTSQVLNEGVVKFNQKVKEMWLIKLKADSIIGQENLNLMRLRRTNLDRVEKAESIEALREEIRKYETEGEMLQLELNVIQSQSEECQVAYEALGQKDKQLDRTFKNHFADLSPVVVEQCYKFFKKRPKWQHRGTLTPHVLYDLANAVVTGVRPPLLHLDCLDFLRGVDHLDHVSNMPPVMDEGLWTTMCKLRRHKIENEIRLRAVGAEVSSADSAASTWRAAVLARRTRCARARTHMQELREEIELKSRNRTIQLVLPAGQVEITTTGHIEDFEDATLIRREEIEKINNVILKVGEMKLKMMRQQMEFRKGILTKEWEHAQMKMRLRHMEQELYSYQRLKIPKELQLYLKNKALGSTDEQEYIRMEKEIEASKVSVNKMLAEEIRRVEETGLKINQIEAQARELEQFIVSLNVKVSEKKLNEDPLEPIRIRRVFKKRMETLILRSKLIREVQANHSQCVMLQTELELLRLKTYPTLASFKTLG